jgi:hypothetical protein
MAWYLPTGELYTGETHELAGTTYSGKTRTPDSRRLVEGPEPTRSRSSKGRLKADDPFTPDINEAYSKPKKKVTKKK